MTASPETPGTVMILGMLPPNPINLAECDVDEVWGCNRCYDHEGWHFHRMYFMDHLSVFIRNSDMFVRKMNALADMNATRVIGQEHYPEIPASEAYPFDDVCRTFGMEDHPYFTSTPAYMIAHAIYDGVDRLIVNNFHCHPLAEDYEDQKSCLDFWLGVALGHGVQVDISKSSHLIRPYPWQGRAYGYHPDRPILKKLIQSRRFEDVGVDCSLGFDSFKGKDPAPCLTV